MLQQVGNASLLDAGNFVGTLQTRQGLQTGCLEEIAYQQRWIDAEAVAQHADVFAKNAYGAYLRSLLD
jgi:glucose-1-phosphate thymidylyltransferase